MIPKCRYAINRYISISGIPLQVAHHSFQTQMHQTGTNFIQMFHWHSHMNFITLKIANKSFLEKTFVGKIFGLCTLEHAHERIHYHHLCSLDFGELCCMCVYVNLIFYGWFKGFVSSVVQLRYENCLNNDHTIISHHSKYGEHI